MLLHIIPSKTRRKILALFFQNHDKHFHLRKVQREVDEEVNAVKRELDILEKEGILQKEKRVNKVIYGLNSKYIFFEEFLRIFAKQTSFICSFLKNQAKIGQVKYIVLSQKYAKKQKLKEGEIYLLCVGIIVIPEVIAIVSEEEKKFNAEINYTVMTEEEFIFRKKNNDPFIWAFLKQPKMMIVGNEEQLMK